MTLARMILAPALLMSVPALGSLLPETGTSADVPGAVACRVHTVDATGPGFALLGDPGAGDAAICR